MQEKMAWKCGAMAGPLGPGLVRPATEEFAKEAVTALRAGKVIAVPTDTLYGFACDAWYAYYLVVGNLFDQIVLVYYNK